MRTLTAATLVAAFTPFVFAAVDISAIPRIASAKVVPGAYIVELTGAGELPGSSGAKRSYSPHAQLYKALRKRDAIWDVQQEYHADKLFVGATITLQDEADLQAVASIQGVKSIYPVYLHDRPRPLNVHIPDGPHDAKVPPDAYSTHKMTGVDKLHAEGIKGKGIKIGVIDSGIDYKHPTLGGGFGPEFKVYGGYDFVGDAYGEGDNPAKPDDDPIDQCGGHGTHVAGIIAADHDPTYNFTGVAPEAKLAAYRVFGCKGSVGDDILLQALLRAYRDGNDIITLSIGGARGWTSTATAVVASRIAQAGRVVTIAAGNDGDFGSWYASSPGTAVDGISVASVDNTQTLVRAATLSNGHAPIGYGSFKPLNVAGQLPIYALSKDVDVVEDGCKPLPDSTPDLSKYIVLIKRGGCKFVEKLGNAAAKGMKVALFYDNVAGVNGAIDVGNYTAAIITQEDGKYLVGEFAAGREVLLSFPQTGSVQAIESPTGGLVSKFSTYGPVNDLFFKPTIAAPGGNILSTIPVPLGGYAIESGTSMATPFMAGCSALLLQYHEKQIDYYVNARSIFETTAVPIPSSKTDGDPGQTLAQAGAGLVNVYNAIHYKTVVTPSELNLNDTTHAKMEHTITVTNNNNAAQTYTIKHVPAGTAITLKNAQPNRYPVPLVTDYATMTSSAETIQVGPGESKEVTVKFTAPTGVDPKTFPVYSGHVVIQSSSETLSVSYLGVAAALKDMRVLDTSDAYFNVTLPQVLNSKSKIQEGPETYTFDGDDWPTLVFRLVAGTPDLKLDLINASDNTIYGSLGELLYQSRNSDGNAKENGYNTVPWKTPSIWNGTDVPDGDYRFKISALRITGDPAKEEDWDTWAGPIMTVKKSPKLPTSPESVSVTATATATATATTTATSTSVSATSTSSVNPTTP